MQKKSKVTNVSFKKEFTGKFGKSFVFVITFENGDTGEYIGKKQDQDTFVIGAETEYELVQRGNFIDIKPIRQDGNSKGGGKGYYRDPAQEALKERHIARAVALKGAVDLIISGNVVIKDLIPTADKMYNWLTQDESGAASSSQPKNS